LLNTAMARSFFSTRWSALSDHISRERWRASGHEPAMRRRRAELWSMHGVAGGGTGAPSHARQALCRPCVSGMRLPACIDCRGCAGPRSLRAPIRSGRHAAGASPLRPRRADRALHAGRGGR
jgi:hypothetical protein